MQRKGILFSGRQLAQRRPSVCVRGCHTLLPIKTRQDRISKSSLAGPW